MYSDSGNSNSNEQYQLKKKSKILYRELKDSIYIYYIFKEPDYDDGMVSDSINNSMILQQHILLMLLVLGGTRN
jgi:hypothetical protein